MLFTDLCLYFKGLEICLILKILLNKFVHGHSNNYNIIFTELQAWFKSYFLEIMLKKLRRFDSY